MAHVPRQALLRDIADLQEASEVKFKRHPYQKHLNCLTKLDFVFQILARPLPSSSMKDLADLPHIAFPPISTWRNQLRIDPTWRPSRSHCKNAKRLFTDAEEMQLVHFIAENYIDKCLYWVSHGVLASRPLTRMKRN
jgi:hypothetical protein